jgi:hypothetical protein
MRFARLAEKAYDLTALNDAFICACRSSKRLSHHCCWNARSRDPELGRHIDDTTDRLAVVGFFIERQSLDFDHTRAGGLWRAFVIGHVVRYR